MTADFSGDEVSPGRLAGFLQSQKDTFLADLNSGNGKGWTVVMGNEAGDLDTIASSIAFSCLSSTLLADRTIPLILTPSSLMSLRPENLQALKLSQIPLSTLLHPENLPISTIDLSTAGVEFALVDHNRLLPIFGDGQVNSVIDHHDDEGLYLDASIRLIQVPTGSASSLVTKHFKPFWKASLSSPAGINGSPVPRELATLLLGAILIDTGGLKIGGKATLTDYDSSDFLYPISTISENSPSTQNGEISINSKEPPKVLSELAKQLLNTKFDISHLSTHDLLLRDYKEYVLPTSSKSFPTLRVGLSTVPLSLKSWLGKEESGWKSYLKASDEYMVEKGLDLEGILTSYDTEKKGKHRRELVLLVREGAGIQRKEDVERVLKGLVDGLQGAQELGLGVWENDFGVGAELLSSGQLGLVGRVWQQGNAKATRKQVAPLVRDIITKIE